MPDIVHRIGIRATPRKVYAALTEQKGLAGWWTRDTSASPQVGAILKFRFGNHGFNDMKVVRLVPGRQVHWRCVDGAKEWIGTRLSFDLKRQGNRTIVLFAHRGWRRPVEFMHYCSTKWAIFLLSLKSLVEKGRGRPYPNDMDID
jgi:uncharacterized protein YndB with AHSA1/START domain